MRFRLVLFSFVLFVTGCQETDHMPKTLDLPAGSVYTLDNQSQLLRIPVNSNDGWQITGSSAWCTPRKTEGRGNDTLILDVKANLFEARTADWTVKNDETEKKFRITQEASSAPYFYQLPVVFHILYNDPGNREQNVEAAWLYQTLNQVNTYYRQSDKSPEMNLEFVPATHAPDGSQLTEPGINRISWPSSILMDCNRFMDDPNNISLVWDPNRYINIMIYTFSQEQVLGIAYLPYTTGNDRLPGLKTGDRYFVDPSLNYPHCVSINNKYLLTSHPILNLPDAVLTLSHELGHYLGLFHVFGSPGDYCEDTPDYNRTAYENWLSSLTEQVPFSELAQRVSTKGETFVSYNIMDYDFSYLDRFTPDQQKRVRRVIENSPLVPGPKRQINNSRSITTMEIPEARTIE